MLPEILATLDALPALVVIVESSGSIVTANHRFAGTFDETPEGLMGRSLFDLLETDPEGAGEYLRRCASTIQPISGALMFRRSNDEPVECRCSGAALRPGGEFGPGMILIRARPKHEAVVGFAALNRKIADLVREARGRRRRESEPRKRHGTIEQRVEARSQDLRNIISKLFETERQFRNLVASVTDYAIFMLDREGFVTIWNAGAERIKGYTNDEIIGQHFSIFYTEDDRRNGVPEQALATVRHLGRVEMEGWRVRKGGDRFWASVIINQVYDEEGHPAGFAKVTRDLTERRTMEEQLRQIQKLEVIGQLSGGIAHDFNNLLTVIGGNIETLQRRVSRTDPSLHRYLDAAARGVERASTLTYRLLAYSRRRRLNRSPSN